MEMIERPPILQTKTRTDGSYENSIHFYLDFKYLPVRNISIIMKSTNELYELIYRIINDENVPDEDKMILHFAATGNSFDWVGQVLSQFKSTKAKVAILVTAALIYTPIGIEKYNHDVATRELINSQTQLIKAEAEKTLAETKKLKAEAQSIELENIYKKNKIKQDSIAKLNAEKNRKSIMRKRSSIRRATEHPAIKICVVNNINIHQ